MPIEFGPEDRPQQSGGAIVPFGKYRGKPIEAMLQDPSYCEWFMSQPEMRQKYQNVYQVIINNFGEPSETPESNEMQAKFLSADFRQKFALAIKSTFNDFASEDGMLSACEFAANDMRNVEVKLGMTFQADLSGNHQWAAIGKSEGKKCDIQVVLHEFKSSSPEFEIGGTDVEFEVIGAGFTYARECKKQHCDGSWASYDSWEGQYLRSFRDMIWRNKYRLRIEIKPEVGDDYPAILRQMRRSKSNVLFTRDYTGIGVDEATFVEYFSTQGIKVIFERDVINQAIPEAFKFDAEMVHNEVKKRLVELRNGQKTN
jgi:hypothetical protein